MAQVKLHKLNGGEPEEIALSDCLFAEEINPDLLHRVVQMQLTNRRQGTASTKSRGEVSGGGRKPWRQKGTGRARHGSRRSPIWRGGGITFGPKPREYSYKLPKKMRVKGLRMALSSKYKEDRISVVDKLEFAKPQTKEGLRVLERFGFQDKVLVILSSEEDNVSVRKSFSNIPGVKCLPVGGANVYDLIKYEDLLITQAALRKIEERIC